MVNDLFQSTELDKFLSGLREGTETRRVFYQLYLKQNQRVSTYDIMAALFPDGKAGLFRLSARIFDLDKRLREIGWCITGETDKDDRRLYWYRLEKFMQTDWSIH